MPRALCKPLRRQSTCLYLYKLIKDGHRIFFFCWNEQSLTAPLRKKRYRGRKMDTKRRSGQDCDPLRKSVCVHVSRMWMCVSTCTHHIICNVYAAVHCNDTVFHCNKRQRENVSVSINSNITHTQGCLPTAFCQSTGSPEVFPWLLATSSLPPQRITSVCFLPQPWPWVQP